MCKFFVKSISVIVLAGLLVLRAPMVSAATETELLAATDAATAYLGGKQQTDGSIDGSSRDTDWTVIAVVANGQNPEEIVSGEGNSLVDALESNPLDTSASATDVERRILAIAAAGQDTEDFGGVDYNQLLSAHHIDNQIGDPTFVNDDTFGIMAVAVTEDETLKPMAQDAVNYLLANQETNGGFSWAALSNPGYSGPDSNSTAAAIVALQTAKDIGLTAVSLNDSVDDAVVYLLSLQHASGGFLSWSTDPDVGSTAWALMALNTFGDLYAAQKDAALAWLLGIQKPDGGFYLGSWNLNVQTTDAMLALLGTNWLLTPKSIKQVTPEAPVVVPTVTATSSNAEAEPQATTVVAAASAEIPAQATPAVQASTEPVQQESATSRRYVTPVVLAATAAQADEPQTSSASTTVAPEANTGVEQVLGDSTSKDNNILGFVLIGVAVAGFAAYALRSRFSSRPE